MPVGPRRGRAACLPACLLLQIDTHPLGRPPRIHFPCLPADATCPFYGPCGTSPFIIARDQFIPTARTAGAVTCGPRTLVALPRPRGPKEQQEQPRGGAGRASKPQRGVSWSWLLRLAAVYYRKLFAARWEGQLGLGRYAACLPSTYITGRSADQRPTARLGEVEG